MRKTGLMLPEDCRYEESVTSICIGISNKQTGHFFTNLLRSLWRWSINCHRIRIEEFGSVFPNIRFLFLGHLNILSTKVKRIRRYALNSPMFTLPVVLYIA